MPCTADSFFASPVVTKPTAAAAMMYAHSRSQPSRRSPVQPCRAWSVSGLGTEMLLFLAVDMDRHTGTDRPPARPLRLSAAKADVGLLLLLAAALTSESRRSGRIGQERSPETRRICLLCSERRSLNRRAERKLCQLCIRHKGGSMLALKGRYYAINSQQGDIQSAKPQLWSNSSDRTPCETSGAGR